MNNLFRTLSIIIIMVLLSILFLGIYNGINNYQGVICDENCLKCCSGSPCSDTYYNAERNVCIYTLCANSLFIKDKKECEYKPNEVPQSYAFDETGVTWFQIICLVIIVMVGLVLWFILFKDTSKKRRVKNDKP